MNFRAPESINSPSSSPVSPKSIHSARGKHIKEEGNDGDGDGKATTPKKDEPAFLNASRITATQERVAARAALLLLTHSSSSSLPVPIRQSQSPLFLERLLSRLPFSVAVASGRIPDGEGQFIRALFVVESFSTLGEQ